LKRAAAAAHAARGARRRTRATFRTAEQRIIEMSTSDPTSTTPLPSSAPNDFGSAPELSSAAASGNGAQAPAATPTASADLERRLAELEARHADVSDAYLRAKAETENARRRAEEEIAKARKFAVEAFAESLLPVRDSLEAAVANTAATPEQVFEGVRATLRQLTAALERNKVVEVDPAPGAKFDPHQHQAISVVPLPAGSTQEPNSVVGVLQKGYLIADRVLRPALVTVAAAG
jgi:molecular chaperone GrpE